MQPLGLTLQKKTSPITLKSMLAAGWLLVSGLFLMPHSLNGQEVAGAPENYQTRPSPHFKPNKGQVADHEGDLIKAYEYVYQAPGMKVGLTQNGFHYNVYTVEEKAKPDKKVSEATGKPVNAEQQPERPSDKEAAKQTTYHYHRVEVAFKGANEDPDIIAGKQMDYYANYYLGYLPEYVTQVHGYRKLTYKNLYDKIDLVLRPATAEKGRPKLKYNIRVRPGGDLSDVKLVYKGMDKLTLEDGKLQIATSQGRMTETIPKSYWAESKEATAVNYQLEGNTVSFQAKQEQEDQALVVDPSLSWSTFLGGSNYDYGNGVTTDGSGNVYVTGSAESGFPTTSGAYQTSYGGGYRDAFLSKFTSSGSLSWSTYLGGSEDDEGEGVTTDGSGNVYVTGYADTTFPTTSGAYQGSFGGGRDDAFLSKFTSSGSLSWSTYLGGSSGDEGYGVTTDGSGNVYVTGDAGSGFPTTSGAYQGSYGGGGYDAFLSKFTSGGSLSWSTYLGGGNDDRGNGVTTDGSGNVYVTGKTESTGSGYYGFPTTPGAYQTSSSGGSDAFLSKFTSSGGLSWSTYLGGSNDDRGFGVTTDGSGNVYVTGNAGRGFPTTSGAYQASFGGGSGVYTPDDAFLSKFNSGGSLSWSTYLGGSDDDKGYGVTTDGSGNVYVTGVAESGFPSTSGAYQTSYGGYNDAFLSKFTKSGFLSYSTYLGGNDIDNGYDVAIDGSGNVYVTGVARSGFPTTSGAYQTSFGGSGFKSDAFLSKFDFAKLNLTAGFTSDSACLRDTLKFVDTSSVQGSGTITQYDWHFGDGDSASGKSVKHTYDTAGNYNVELIVTTANGNKDTATRNSKVYPKPTADFTVNDTGQCKQGNSYQFSDQSSISSGTLSYDWDFGDGDTSDQQSPTHSYSSYGNYNTELIVTSGKGCKDTANETMDVHPMPQPDFGYTEDSSQCLTGNQYSLTNNSTIAKGSQSYNWDFGDNTTSTNQAPTHSYSSPGTYTIELVATSDSGCMDTTTRKVTVEPMPTADFTVNDTGQCKQGNSYQFTDQSSISAGTLNYDWDFGDGDTSDQQSPTHSYGSYGNYNSKLIVTSGKGCKDTANETMDVHPMPQPAFSYTQDSSQCLAGNQYSLTNNSTIAKGSQTYSWDFGDNTTSTSQAPTHSYSSPGTYTLELVATSDSGCVDTTTRKVTVEPMPTADFTVNDTGQCKQGNSYQFTDQSSISAGSLNYDWDFGDGSSATTASPTHSYSSYGNYNTEVIVTSAKGCQDTADETMDVHPMPNPAFSYTRDSSQCLAGNQYSLTNNSTISKGSQSYSWDFGDNSTSTKQAPTHSYSSPGTYTIKLVATSDSGCVDTTTRKVTVEPMPTADFTVNDTGQCKQGNSYQFTDQSSISSGSLNYDWDFGDGSGATTASPTHSFGSYGNYNSKLTVTSGKGCKDTANETMDVHPMPNPAFSYTEDSSQCLAGNQYSLTNNSTIAKGSQSYSWDFGDNTTSTKQAPTHSYSSPGTYTIELVATSDSGCVDTTTRKVTVEPMPTADFTVNDTGQCKQGNSYQFTDQSSISSGSLNYDWDFGDGDTSDQQSPTHSYSSYGNYNSELIVTSGKGCQDTADETMNVHPMPTADFTVNDTGQCLEGNSYQFTDESDISAGSLTYDWAFGDGDTSDQSSTVHSYDNNGIYQATLVVASGRGCQDTASEQMTAHPMPTPAFVYPEDSLQCLEGNMYSFDNQSSIASGTQSYQWEFGDDSTTTATSPGHSYESTGNYEVQLIATSDQGCQDTAIRKVAVAPMPSIGFTYTKLDYETVAFEANDTTLPNYRWAFGDQDSASVPDPKHVYENNGTFVVSLVATNKFGCPDASLDTVTMTNVGLDRASGESAVSLKAYPNPFSNDLSISYKLPSAKDQVRLAVVDQKGRLIVEQDLGSQNSGKYTKGLDAMKGAPAGTYYIRLIINDKQQVERVVKVE